MQQQAYMKKRQRTIHARSSLPPVYLKLFCCSAEGYWRLVVVVGAAPPSNMLLFVKSKVYVLNNIFWSSSLVRSIKVQCSFVYCYIRCVLSVLIQFANTRAPCLWIKTRFWKLNSTSFYYIYRIDRDKELLQQQV